MFGSRTPPHPPRDAVTRRPANPITLTSELTEKFWSHVIRSEVDGCWGWNGPASGNGRYANVKQGIRANRYSFALHYYAPPVDMDVCHTCDNPKCTRPDHLVLGTPGENHWDSVVKGRDNPQPKPELASPQAHKFAAILRVLELGKAGKDAAEIASEIGITKRRVLQIQNQYPVSVGGNRRKFYGSGL